MKMTTTETQLRDPDTIVLSAPEVLTEIPKEKAVEKVQLPPEMKAAVDTQLDGFVTSLINEDFGSDAFKAKVDSAFSLGRKEISDSAMLTGRFMDNNFVGAEDSAAFKAINQLRNLFDDLNPATQGDLFQPKKILGFIPFGNNLQSYFRKFESAGAQIQKLMGNLISAQDEIRKDAVEIANTESKLWESMIKLRATIYFAEGLDRRISEEVLRLAATDPMKSRALEQEVLFYSRQAVADMFTQQSINVNAYISMGVLKKTAREMITGCDRMETIGMSALSVATTVARATGNQIQVMEMLQGASKTIGSLVEGTSVALGQHVEKTADFSSNPTIAIEHLQASFNNTFAAMDKFDKFRSDAIVTMGKNNDLLKTLVAQGEEMINHKKAAAPSAAIEGPVTL
jgi:uncharacterized protein YaaN involved in tellurite resistance